MLCEKAGEVTAQTRSDLLQLGAIFRAYSHVRTYSKVRRYLLYPSKQLYNPQHDHGMTDLLALVEGDVVVVNDKESVGTCYSLG